MGPYKALLLTCVVNCTAGTPTPRLCPVVQWSVHWAPSRTTRVLVLRRAGKKMRAPLLGLVKSIYYSSPKCFFYFLDHILLYSFSGLNDKELSFVLRGVAARRSTKTGEERLSFLKYVQRMKNRSTRRQENEFVDLSSFGWKRSRSLQTPTAARAKSRLLWLNR